MLDGDGHLAEGATSNLFFVRNDALCTPSLDGPVLPGITRAAVLDIADAEGLPVREGAFTPEDLRGAAEAFVTNSTWEIRPVGTVDGIDVGGGPLTTLFRRVFDARIEAAHYDGKSRERDDGAGGRADSDADKADGRTDEADSHTDE